MKPSREHSKYIPARKDQISPRVADGLFRHTLRVLSRCACQVMVHVTTRRFTREQGGSRRERRESMEGADPESSGDAKIGSYGSRVQS